MAFLFPRVLLAVLSGLFFLTTALEAQQRGSGPQREQDYRQQVQPNRQAPENQTQQMREWGGGQTISPQEWSRRYSPLGTRRAPIETEARERRMIAQPTLDPEVRARKDFSQQDRRFFRRNRDEPTGPEISTDLVSNLNVYDAHFPVARRLHNKDGEIDLDSINRYVHKRNEPRRTSPNQAPVQQAGSGE